MAFARPLFAACLGLAIASTAQASSRTPYVNDPMEKHMGNALMQPLRDINLKKDKIPPRLLQIQDDPYNIQDMSGCRAIVTEIVSLRPMLGPDVNEVQLQSDEELREESASRIAGGLIGGLIPFRGVVRELTGANAAERDYLTALTAGFARRSFLKGIAVSQGCLPPPKAFRMVLAYDLQGF